MWSVWGKIGTNRSLQLQLIWKQIFEEMSMFSFIIIINQENSFITRSIQYMFQSFQSYHMMCISIWNWPRVHGIVDVSLSSWLANEKHWMKSTEQLINGLYGEFFFSTVVSPIFNQLFHQSLLIFCLRLNLGGFMSVWLGQLFRSQTMSLSE